MTAGELLAGYGRRDFSPVEVMRHALERAHAFQPDFNAFVLLDERVALAMATESERRWLRGAPAGMLDGVPVAVKDTIAVKGWPTRFGSLAGRHAGAAEEDAPMVQRLREHGAAFIGKTAAPEFAWKGLTDSAAHGITRNPWDRSRTPGGSSGGSAVAVALGVVPLATGADGGGSLRIPASFTGIYGLKPTAGLVPNLPTPLGTVGVVGGLSRTAADAALFLRAVVAPDARDSFAAPPFAIGEQAFGAGLERPIAGLRIAVSRSLGFDDPAPEVDAVLSQTIANLHSLGVEVEEVDLAANDMLEAFETIWSLSFAEILARLGDEARGQVEPALLAVAHAAEHVTGLQAQAANRMARVFSARLAALFTRYDLLLTPTVPIAPFAAGTLVPDPQRYRHWWNWTPTTWAFNLSRNPAASCPAGMTADGLPVGVQLVGRWFDENTVLRVSRALEAFHPHPGALSALPAPRVPRNP